MKLIVAIIRPEKLEAVQAALNQGDVYLMTGNYGVLDDHDNTVPPAPSDLPESIVKLHYTAPAGGTAGRLEPVAWFMPFIDHHRNSQGEDDFQDYDLGSAGPVVAGHGRRFYRFQAWQRRCAAASVRTAQRTVPT